MGLKLECECGHGKSNHAATRARYEIVYMYCNVLDCKCRVYKFSKRVNINNKFHVSERVIKSGVRHKHANSKIYRISQLGPDGKVHDF